MKRVFSFLEALERFAPWELWNAYVAARAARDSLESQRPEPGWTLHSGRAEAWGHYRVWMRKREADYEIARERLADWLIDQLGEDRLTGMVLEDPLQGQWRLFRAISWRGLKILDLEAGEIWAAGKEFRSVQIFIGSYREAKDFIESLPTDNSLPPDDSIVRHTPPVGRPSERDAIEKAYRRLAKLKAFPKTRTGQAKLIKRSIELHSSEKTISNWLSKKWPEGSPDDPARNREE